MDASVGAFYLREIAATNFQATIKLDGSHILLKPFQLTLNNAPMFATADVDMSVPGYKYVLTCNTTNVPFAPLWNTFKPEEKGKVGGTLTAYANIGGTGTSGESLQKTLTGNFHVGTTNLNLSVTTIHNRMLRGLVEVVAALPDFAQNPASVVNFAGNAVFGKLNGSLSHDLEKSPIDVITTDGVATNGQVIIKNTVVRSPTFEATVAKGTITLAPVLTNSTINIPISIALNNAIIGRFPLLGESATSTNGGYTKLPDFFSEQGTIGEPKKHISPTAFGKGVIRNLIPGLVGTNGILSQPLEGLGDLLHGGPSANQPATNNPPATNNQPAVNSIPNRFMGK